MSGIIAVFERSFPVTESVLDANGHVNNVAYVQWMQDLGIQHAEANGCVAELYQRLGVTWVARSHHIDYHRSAYPGDVIRGKTWLDETRKTACRRRYLFHRHHSSPTDCELVASASTEWVYIDVKSGRPRKIDQQIIDRFEILAEPPRDADTP